MKRFSCLGLTVAAGLALAGAARAEPVDPSGTWLTQDGRARIRLEKCGTEQICGYVVWLKEPGEGDKRLDIKNPDASLRGRGLLGHQLLAGLRPNSDGRYAGQIYNSEDGKKYDVTIWIERPAELKLRGCLVAFLCSTQNWTRANDLAPGQLAGATGAQNGPQPDREWARFVPAPAAATKRDPKPKS